MKSLVSASLGSGWIRLHPESVENIPANITIQQMKPRLSPDAMKNQMNTGFAWEATNWNGACDELAKIAKPTLVITGTDDNHLRPACKFFSHCRKNPRGLACTDQRCWSCSNGSISG